MTVSPRGTIIFRLDYRLNGRRETLTIGRHASKEGISLLMAHERRLEARKAITEGQAPSQEKQREKCRMSEAKTFDEFTKRWLEEARMADRTKPKRKSIIGRDITPVFQNRLLAEIGSEDLRNLCAKAKARWPPPCACTTSSSRSSASRPYMATRRRIRQTKSVPHRSPRSSPRAAVAVRDPRHTPGAGRHLDPADHLFGASPDPADVRA